MKKFRPSEFMFEVFALILIAVARAGRLCHGHPAAGHERSARHDAAMMAKDPNYVPERSIYVVVKDPEQEVCFILAFWAISIIGYKAATLRRGRRTARHGPAAAAGGHEDPAGGFARLRAAGRSLAGETAQAN